jgi:hypothetical protein
MGCGASESAVIRFVNRPLNARLPAMLPRLRLVIVSLAAALALIAVAFGFMSSARNGPVFAIGLRSAQGSPVERALPEPPDWKQLAALAAARRADELNRLLELPASAPADHDAGTSLIDAQNGADGGATTRVAPTDLDAE